MSTTRRRVLHAIAAAGSVAVAGCADAGGPPGDADVVAGPDSSLAFEPESLAVSTGETVTWYFDSQGHNVSCVPAHHDESSTPEGAEPFASYDGDRRFRTVARGETYEHTFETPGTYRYVCVPHASAMVGEVRVE